MKFSQIQTVNLKCVPQNLYRKMYRLNYAFKNYIPNPPTRFLLRQKLAWYRYNGNAYVHYILDSEKRLAAWALSFETKGIITRYKWHTYFYTRVAYRRMGLGTKLAREAKRFILKKFNVDPKFYPHDDRSIGFFESIRDEKISLL